MFHPAGKFHGFPDPAGSLVGPEAFKTVHRSFCGAFPDLHVTIEELVAEADRVAIRWLFQATHSGDHLGFPAGSRKAMLYGSSFILVKDGWIMKGWNQMDLEAMMQKLKACPRRSGAAYFRR